MRCWPSGWTSPPRPQEDFDIQYVTHSYYGETYQRSAYQDISPDVIALYRYQKNNRTYSVTHSDGYAYTYDSLYPAAADGAERTAGGRAGRPSSAATPATSPSAAICASRSTLLIVGDDSVLPVIPFLASHYSQIRFVDLADLSEEQIAQIDCSQYQRLLIAYSVDTFIHEDIPEKVALLQTVQTEEAISLQPGRGNAAGRRAGGPLKRPCPQEGCGRRFSAGNRPPDRVAPPQRSSGRAGRPSSRPPAQSPGDCPGWGRRSGGSARSKGKQKSLMHSCPSSTRRVKIPLLAVPCPGEGLGLCAVSKQHKSAQDEQGGKDKQSPARLCAGEKRRCIFCHVQKETDGS